MALRAGYYGLKKKFIDKVNKWDQIVFPRSEQAVLGAKQFYNIDAPALQLSNVTATKSNNGWQIQTSASAAYPFASFPVNIPANTDIRFSCGVAITSGSSVISIDGSNDGSSYTPVKQIFSPAANVNEVFNSGNYKYYRIRLFTNFNETASTDGNILYSNILFTLASDTDRTYAPYAMTNKELTDAVYKLFKKVVYTSTEALEIAANGYADVNIDSVSGYQILTKSSTLSGSGSSAYGYVSAAGGSNIVRFANRDSSSHTWNYEITVWYIANDAFI